MATKDHVTSSGNVFADLNLPQADDLMAKAELAAKIIAEIQSRRMTQAQAAAILRIDQPKISALKQGKLSGFLDVILKSRSKESPGLQRGCAWREAAIFRGRRA
jgi:predicted XRE-type DNA-binding protein